MADSSSSRHETQEDALARSLEAESLAALAMSARGRLVTIAVLAAFFAVIQSPRLFAINLAGLAIFALLPFLHLRYARRQGMRSWSSYFFASLDLVALTLLLFVANPWVDGAEYPQMIARYGIFAFYFIFLANTALTYEPRLALVTGFAAAALWMLAAGGQILFLESTIAQPWSYNRTVFLDPSAVLLHPRLNEAIAIALTGALLATAVARGRHLVLSQAALSRERANLARYFAPTVVEALSRQDEPLAAVREQPVAVLFADIVGFTRLAEEQSPQETIALLREFHARLEDCVFRYHGTLDKFLGDGLMATFGNPAASEADADNALKTAQEMVTEIAGWNAARSQAGQQPVQLSLGLHYGPVVLGNIGAERRLEWAVLGDTVNVASRLEGRSRALGTALVVSEALVARLTDPELAANLRPAAPQTLHNREEPVAVRVA